MDYELYNLKPPFGMTKLLDAYYVNLRMYR